MPGKLFDLALEFRSRDCRGLEPRHRAIVGAVGHEIELVIDHGSVPGEHYHGQVLACAVRHVAIHCGERFKDSTLIRVAIVQEYRLDLGIETTLLRVEKRAGDVLCIAMSEIQSEVP